MFRNIRIEDAADIHDINTRSLGYDLELVEVEAKIGKLIEDEHHIIIVYEDESINKVIAYIHAEIYDNLYSCTGLNILALAVLPEFQRNGLGKILLNILEVQAKVKKCAFVRLNSGADRTLAHKFYESLEYESDKYQLRFIKKFEC